MVKFNDLRIRNIILYNLVPSFVLAIDSKNVELSTDINDEFGVISKYNSEVSGIHITPELLTKFGFKSNNGLKFSLKIKGIRYFVYQNSANDYSISRDAYYFAFNIQYLHELQNILHSCTKFELLDLVAYNYYQQFCPYDYKFTFEEFLSNVGNRTNWNMGINFEMYTFGDLPKNLFQ